MKPPFSRKLVNDLRISLLEAVRVASSGSQTFMQEAWTLPDNVRVFHPADDSAGGNSHHPAAAIAWKTWVLTDESGLEKSRSPPAKESGTQGTQGTQWLLSRRMLGTFLGLVLILTVLWLLTLVQKWRDQVSPNEFALYASP